MARDDSEVLYDMDGNTVTSQGDRIDRLEEHALNNLSPDILQLIEILSSELDLSFIAAISITSAIRLMGVQVISNCGARNWFCLSPEHQAMSKSYPKMFGARRLLSRRRQTKYRCTMSEHERVKKMNG
jgi:hypothetical protein